jgi:hypothetical protein
MTNIEKIMATIKGEVVDYDMISNGTLFVLVKSDKGNYSIRQAFRNIYGEYHGFNMVKMMRNVGREVAMMEFEEMMSEIQ